jgi:phosphoribosylamine--glycine ligase
MIAEGMDYRGFIFFGIMLTPQGPKLLEYNVRLGDPETQAVLPLMDFDFAQMCQAITAGTLKDFDFKWKPGFICAPVAVSGGYPESYKKGMAITLPQQLPEGSKVFLAGATLDRRATNGTNQLVTSGGRVLATSAYGATFQEAWDSAYAIMKQVSFDGMFYRQDIGLPGAAESGNL